MSLLDTAATSDQAVRDRYTRDGHDQRSDAALVGHVARRLAVPRLDPADSFVLHAPLELAARAALLPFVEPRRRHDARLRLITLAEGFEQSGPPLTTADDQRVDPVGTVDTVDTVDTAAHRLAAAVDAGELDDVDTAARALGRLATPSQMQQALGPVVIDRLSGAAHAPIFLYHLPRVAPRGEMTSELLRVLARELARYPDWRLQWTADRNERGERAGRAERSTSTPEALFDAVASTPRIHEPGNTFIYPLMSFVDTEGIAPGLLTDVTAGDDVRASGRALLRAAAWTMLIETDEHAPYGWSHCLTLPQGALGIAHALPDPSHALAVAATYVVGFRSALANEPLDPIDFDDPGIDLRDAFDHGSKIAAAAAWHAVDDRPDEVIAQLATRAATQHDAHLVKYTLACFDAAADDPDHRRLFLSAAASLTGYWASRTNPDDPLLEPVAR